MLGGRGYDVHTPGVSERFFAPASRVTHLEVLCSTPSTLWSTPTTQWSTPLGGAADCPQVKILEKPFRSLRSLSAHPSQLQIGVLPLVPCVLSLVPCVLSLVPCVPSLVPCVPSLVPCAWPGSHSRCIGSVYTSLVPSVLTPRLPGDMHNGRSSHTVHSPWQRRCHCAIQV